MNQGDVFAAGGEGEIGDMDLCEWERTPEPCTIVIFGASGDLTYRKLVPALYKLYSHEGLPERYCVVGVGRTQMNDDAFRAKMRQGIAESGVALTRWAEFERSLYYLPVYYDDLPSYTTLSRRLAELEHRHQTMGNIIFNLAIPPSVYETIARALGSAGLSREDNEKGNWRRLVVEKPFGYDLASARKLNKAISESFREDQVFRIDHYMTKETVQNILIFRFANAIFEPIWNRNYIDHVRINASESLGIEHRAGYYERSGVLRDMFQNHMMQMLSLVGAEPPSRFSANLVRDKKVELFRSLRPVPLEDLDDHLILGQYTKGEIQGKEVPGYREEPGVNANSVTPTYALMRVFVDNWRWQGVPFYITSGKRLKWKVTRIDIQFKAVPHSIFRQTIGEDVSADRLIVSMHPKEAIFLNFQSKKPGTRLCLRTAGLHFSFYRGHEGPKLDAYEKALIDTMLGDQTLFWRQDSLELSWAFLDPVLNCAETCDDRSQRLHPYAAGSLGPQAALDMLPPGSWPEKP